MPSVGPVNVGLVMSTGGRSALGLAGAGPAILARDR